MENYLIDTNEITDTKSMADFILGGNAQFTIFQEPDTQAKYKVKMGKNKDIWFVSMAIGGKENAGLVYQGYIKQVGNGKYQFYADRNWSTTYNKRSADALVWMLNNSRSKAIPKIVHMFHHGTCSMCGRKLTDAESLRTGLGPVCRKRAGRE